MRRIIVCIGKPDEGDNDINGTSVKDEHAGGILDTDNENALEAALRIKDKDPDWEVIALMAGQPDEEDMLRESVAMGADNAILISDAEFDYENPRVVAAVLAAGIKKLKRPADLIIAGYQTFDLGIIQVTPQLSHLLRIPLISQVSDLDLTGDKATAKSELENCTLDLRADLPCILSVLREINTPRYTTIQNMLMSLEFEIEKWDATDLAINENDRKKMFDEHSEIFLSFSPKPRESGITVSGGTPEEIADNLMDSLRKKAVL